MNKKHFMGLTVSIILIIYSAWMLYKFYEPKVGPVGHGPSLAVVIIAWILFGISLILGTVGIIYFLIQIVKKK